MIGGATLPWNPRKSWAGLVCFLGFGGTVASLFHWAEPAFNAASIPGTIPLGVSLVCGFGAAFAGAIVESLDSRVNDNIRVGLAAGVAAAGLHLLLVNLLIV